MGTVVIYYWLVITWGGHSVRGVLPMVFVHAKWGRGMTVRDAMAGTILVAIDRPSVHNAMGRSLRTR